MGRRAHPRGFTLIELIVTLAILALLASAAMPMAELSVQRAKERELREALRQIREGIDAYRQAVDDGRIANALGKSGYPPSLRALVDGVPDRTSPDAKSAIYLLRRIPRDPMATDETIPAEATWGLRSYASPPDAPAEGDDVFDVYSLADGTGLNGIPYRQW